VCGDIRRTLLEPIAGPPIMESQKLTAGRIAEIVAGTLRGEPDVRIDSVGALDEAGPGQVTFAVDQKHLMRLAGSRAGAVIVPASADLPAPPPTLILVANVQQALARLLGHLCGAEHMPPVGCAPSAEVSADASLGRDVRVGPGVVVGPGASIGQGTVLLANVSVGRDVHIGRDAVLYPGVCICHGCEIGDRVRIGPNSVVGYDGFGYYFAEGRHNKIPHAGNVVIADDVEIGACACIDRAKFGSTRIGAGTKIDNLVQIAHNVQVGHGCVIAALGGVAGSARLGDYVVLGGHAGIRDNISIGQGVTCAAYTAITRDVPDGQTMFGIPAVPAQQKLREVLLVQKLPQLVKRVNELENRLKTLELSKDH